MLIKSKTLITLVTIKNNIKLKSLYTNRNKYSIKLINNVT